MKKRILYLLCPLTLFICSSWGFYAHKKINQTAVFLLPSEMASFYKQNSSIITERAVDADKRCYVDTLESPRHYIDVDDLDAEADSIPIHWRKAKEKYTERKLLAAGIVPWQIQFSYQKLVRAFVERDYDRIIRHSADIGHYIADAHVPLHTTSNYNGQQTNQIGIHAFWETRLPEMFAEDYDLFVGPANYVNAPLDTAWKFVKQSNMLVDSVLQTEKELSRTFKKSEQKAYINRNNQLILTYSDAYANAYHEALNKMVERRFRASIKQIASYWYSAWIDAGQPNLQDLEEQLPAESEELQIEGMQPKGRQEWH